MYLETRKLSQKHKSLLSKHLNAQCNMLFILRTKKVGKEEVKRLSISNLRVVSLIIQLTDKLVLLVVLL